jgi:hypothetical protein
MLPNITSAFSCETSINVAVTLYLNRILSQLQLLWSCYIFKNCTANNELQKETMKAHTNIIVNILFRAITNRVTIQFIKNSERSMLWYELHVVKKLLLLSAKYASFISNVALANGASKYCCIISQWWKSIRSIAKWSRQSNTIVILSWSLWWRY